MKCHRRYWSNESEPARKGVILSPMPRPPRTGEQVSSCTLRFKWIRMKGVQRVGGYAEEREWWLQKSPGEGGEAGADEGSHWWAITAKREKQIECETFLRARNIAGFYDLSELKGGYLPSFLCYRSRSPRCSRLASLREFRMDTATAGCNKTWRWCSF